MGIAWRKSYDEKWKAGETIIANIDDFNITSGKAYTIISNKGVPGEVCIKNDIGIVDEYTSEYFDRVIRSGVQTTDESIRIYAKDGNEITFWHKVEYESDPKVVVEIVKAVDIFHTKGEDALRAFLFKDLSLDESL